MKINVGFIILLCFFSCSEKVIKPSYIQFQTKEDSIVISAINRNNYPLHVYVEQNSQAVTDTLILLPKESNILLRLSSQDDDTLSILENYGFRGAYGNPKMTVYDTLYNYQLPFPKGKKYTVLQGNDTNFTHDNDFSRYAIDFRMPIGDTVCAARSGYIAGIVQHHKKQGTNPSYRDYANFITMYHKDGTFSQYVHLKQNGALVVHNQYVEKGDPIGLSGHTGWSTEPHLHFAVFKSKPFEFVSIPILINGRKSQSINKWDLATH
ncbi:Peptidase family M23 [Formosa sp. Hel1_31_208]|uniref:M23 family metallopeptidase n=1 Tax=Formosa sp. Hel1_31_208 TaxID=1798225 RepID=UPI00087A65C0|nr:M23 family metallopeptidase [Formosa sp. Hel1_31_208]SDS65833.1 Peptidase family M23 [Formosa sp. Hel1_31_208]